MGYFIQADVTVPARTPDTHTRLRGLSGGGLRYYNPPVGRWASRDPAAEQGGDNLFAFVENGPIVHSDALGLTGNNSPPSTVTKGCCNGQIYDPSSQCCCDGTTVSSLAKTDTGVSVCKGWIKGDPIWGWISSHTFLKCGGKGFGLYAKTSAQGCTCQTFNDDGVLKSNDLKVYPELPDPQTGQPYSTCTSVQLSPCEYDIEQFEKCVCAYNEPGYDPGYMLVFWNCGTFVKNAINHCMQQAKKKTPCK